MRRQADSYLNATQILKVAGIDKGRRTKILEKEIINGDHEKVQGGYGKYQGTWWVGHYICSLSEFVLSFHYTVGYHSSKEFNLRDNSKSSISSDLF